ncbi:uncharacterized protein LOC143034149 [Oratosquilla oratoria]|uniref:uncharacterized protein LOC143034149 n=1 Tax=Oratosquilla oratoria TaxID=337810 RepID=UPI003F775AF3
MGGVDMGWGRQRRLPLFFLLLAIAGTGRDNLASGETAAAPQCWCHVDWSVALEEQLNAQNFNIDDFTPSSYPGIVEGGGSTCPCYDILPMMTQVTVWKQSIVDSVITNADGLASNVSVLAEFKDALVESVEAIFSSPFSWTSDVKLQFVSKETSNSPANLKYELFVFLKGRDANLEDKVANKEFDNLFKVEGFEFFEFTIPKCLTAPSPTLVNGVLDPYTDNVMGATAKYVCDPGYKINSSNDSATEVQISCGYDRTWTTLPDGVSCVKDEDTSGGSVDVRAGGSWSPTDCDLSKVPTINLGFNDHDGTTNADGTVITYKCKKGIHPSISSHQAEVTCESGVWSDMLPKPLICSMSTCAYPPHVPDLGTSDWDHESFLENTTIIYGCLEGNILSNGKTEEEVTCVAGKWSRKPLGLTCQPDGPKKEPVQNQNLFVMVTIPAAGGLILFILCCLCVTRTDSPLCNICSAKEAP